ncbi:MAG: thiamine biosynthesis protein ThiS [Deltaproteobacteria bacterium]|nr:thiamine biosynthesis protein ThiS [Deltaproteobacteria bacterium]
MPLTVVLAASLRKYVADYDPAVGKKVDAAPGATVRQVAEQLGIAGEEVKLIMVNGRAGEWDTVLQGNERVALFPPVGGG